MNGQPQDDGPPTPHAGSPLVLGPTAAVSSGLALRFVSIQLLQSVLDALPEHVALLDQAGAIIAANRAWRRFADENGLRAPDHGVGTNYLEVCEAARDEPFGAEAAAGIRDVLSGRRPDFVLRYPCPGPEGPGWYELRAAALEAAAGLALVVHRPIGDVVQMEHRLASALTGLARVTERVEAETVYVREELRDRYEFEELVGETDAMRRVMHRVEQVAGTDVMALILGETGTGKELVARAIHARSNRSGRPLVTVNCAALPSTLIESELFGHEKGAFTGAVARKIGRFELAGGGTIFLDEIGDLDPSLQAKLLRVLQHGEFERVGSSATLRADVRVIAATNRDLRTAIMAGAFRPDLYYRLTVFPIEIPPLRERRDDIPLLVWYFVTKHQTRLRKAIDRIPRGTMEVLTRYPWPGNVRELENVIERALIVSSDRTLRLDGVVGEPGVVKELPTTSSRLQDVERAHILRVLEDCDGRVKGRGNAADRLGMKASTLRSRMKKLGILRRPRRGALECHDPA